MPQDAIAAASNPAGMVLIGDRTDLGLSWFRPQRDSTISGSPDPTVNGNYDADKTENFLVPEFGYNRKVRSDLSLGVSVYGHGGMNTDYDRPIPLLGTSRPGIDLAQLFIAPTIAWQVTPKHSLGLSVNLAYQRFEAKGLQNFDQPGFTKHLGKVTNNGYDSAVGAGIHLGWIGQISDDVNVGATYQSKTYMSEFDDYKGLFADGGDFDIPAHYGVGIAIKATPKLTVAADVERIFYSDVNSVGNDSVGKLLTGQQLGANNGPGFGWRDINVYKLGVSYAYNQDLTLRTGYNHSTQPVRDHDALFNILAPGVVQDQLTLGASWKLGKGELSVSYMHAFEDSVKASNAIPNAFGGGDVKLKMHQDSFGITYGWKL